MGPVSLLLCHLVTYSDLQSKKEKEKREGERTKGTETMESEEGIHSSG